MHYYISNLIETFILRIFSVIIIWIYEFFMERINFFQFYKIEKIIYNRKKWTKGEGSFHSFKMLNMTFNYDIRATMDAG